MHIQSSWPPQPDGSSARAGGHEAVLAPRTVSCPMGARGLPARRKSEAVMEAWAFILKCGAWRACQISGRTTSPQHAMLASRRNPQAWWFPAEI